MFLTYHQKLQYLLVWNHKTFFFYSFNYYLNTCIFLFHVISQKDTAKLHPSSQLILHIVSLYTWYLSLVLPAAFCINKAILNTPYFLDTLHPIFLFKYTLHNHHKIVTHVNTYLVWSVQIDIISGLLYIICLSILLRT